jgi:GNAT superfamily N-acetyltransferase
VGASVRDYKSSDEAALLECIIELQDIEREIFSRTAAGSVVAKPYLEHRVGICRVNRGKILVVEQDGCVVGFSAVQVWKNSEEVHEEPYEYAYISEVIVLEEYRGRGFGSALLKAAEQFAIHQGVRFLRIGALAGNKSARRVYASRGFDEHKVVFEKSI